MMKVRDFVVETFLRLTSKTCPYGFEDNFVNDIMPLMFPHDIKKDKHGNYFYEIGESRTVFASHLDTVSKDYIPVTHEFDGNMIRTNGKTTLGADDKAGVTVMLWLMQNKVPGLYYFFIGEEVGCIGSGLAAQYGEFKNKYDRIISFDRRGTDSIITYQSGSRCCSDEFANALSQELNKSGMNYSKDTGGVYTDSAEFVDIISECTNVSVGYYKEHTTNEHQDIEHLISLCSASVNVDWENLPTKRDPKVTEWRGHSSYSNAYSTYDSYNYHDDWYSDSFSIDTPKKKKRNRNRKNSNAKSYYDCGGAELVEFKSHTGIESLVDVNTNDKYSWIIEKYFSDNFTYSELQMVKEYYLDMDNEYDKFFYEYLVDQLIDY